MLPAVHRLRRSADFTSVTRSGVRATRGSVVAYVLPSDTQEAPRVGLIVGRQVGESVARHRVSRVLRASVRDDVMAMPAGCQCVLRALPGAAETGDLSGEARAALRAACQKAGV